MVFANFATSCNTLTCARTPTRVSLIYRTEPTTKQRKNKEKLKSKNVICSEVTVLLCFCLMRTPPASDQFCVEIEHR